jgi:hypothetical protein
MSEPSKRGSNGGNARAAKLTPEERSKIAKAAAAKRWAKKEETAPNTEPFADLPPESPAVITSEPQPIPIHLSSSKEPPVTARTPATPTPAERGRRRASKDKPVSKVYRQALSTAEKEYAETVEELSYHDEMAARLKAKLPRLIQTIRALGGTIDPQAELLQSRQMQPSNYGAPAQNYPTDPPQNLPNPIDPALFQTNSGPLPGLAPAVAQIPPISNTAVGGAMDLDYVPRDDDAPPISPKDRGWV